MGGGFKGQLRGGRGDSDSRKEVKNLRQKESKWDAAMRKRKEVIGWKTKGKEEELGGGRKDGRKAG